MARKNNVPVEIRAEAQRNRNKALEMRLAGKTQAQIAAETGWSKQRVSGYIKKAIADITRENAEEFLELELSRLDAMWKGIWEDATHGDTWKIDRALAIIDMRARLTGSYKAAELKAIAEAKGGISAGAASMLDRLFDAMELAVDAADAADDTDTAEGDE
jgi:hypothetical protein